MKRCKFDVIVVGAGPAGVTAAGSLAGTGISVALLEAGVYAGAENWSGCVYFAESLAQADCFGQEAVQAAPFERRVVRRGTLLHNGLDAVGVELTDPDAFRNCYTVLRPVYDPYFAALAAAKGAVHLAETTVTSLFRKEGRVVGVQTNRGPLYSDIVFIAEGDASHLVRSERLERAPEPHYLQGVKAVLTLPPEELEKRFRLGAAEGAAYEILIRNAQIAGKTARLNVGGFLYTNRDSLSVGYVAPLDNIRNNFRGDHDRLLEWMQGLPYIKELTQGASLSAYGTKIVRSGGWNERPVLVEDGLAVGGASAGLGVDIPFPNFTGPASATGLYFARAARNILKRGRTPNAKNLAREYVGPLRESVYGKNAQHLSRWPGYFGRSSVLFGRTVDVACGTAHFLSSGSLVETGRFLRSHVLSYRGLRESVLDTVRAISSLRLWKPVVSAFANPVTFGHWIANLVSRAPDRDSGFRFILHIGGKDHDAASLPWPMGSLLRRLSPALLLALQEVYANDERPAQEKFAVAVRVVASGFNLSDFFVLPAFGFTLMVIGLATAAWDAFRFSVLKTPATKLLAEPVMAYNETQRKARDLDAIKPVVGFEAKLATNTYRVGSTSHIRTLWPEPIASQIDLSRAALWWVCPARVYVYDAPLAGRGRVTVNFENCIKCESCWRAEPKAALWGRHTDHRLIYRPETGAMDVLLEALRNKTAGGRERYGNIELIDEKLWYLNDDLLRMSREAKHAAAAFMDAVSRLPASADTGRRAWPLALGKRLCANLQKLESGLANDGRHGPARLVESDRKDIELRIAEGGLFHALYCCRRLEERLCAWLDTPSRSGRTKNNREEGGTALLYEDVSKIFPDRIVKEWEEGPMPEAWAETLRAFIDGHKDDPLNSVRALARVSPALGLIAAHHLAAVRVLQKAELTLEPGLCAVAADHLDIRQDIDSVRIHGTLRFVPLAACRGLLLVAGGKGHLVPLETSGLSITPTPAIGFRAAGFADVALDCTVKKYPILVSNEDGAPDTASYLAIALGASEYLCERVKDHATGRVQFPGQMLDTEGRDGIAKLGAVKALIARTEAWRLLLETLYEERSQSAIRNPKSAMILDLLASALAAMAFSPEPGAMGYDAGQVFGGFAYSEDDLLSRSYRDSALFPFLSPGYGAAAKLNTSSGSHPPLGKGGLKGGPHSAIQGEPLESLARQLREIDRKCLSLPEAADPELAGQAKALAVGISMVLGRVENGLSLGVSMEAEAAAAEVLLGLAEDALQKALLSAGRGHVPPGAVFPFEPAGVAVPLEADYEAFCTAAGPPHRSGGFLAAAFDRKARFVPEVQLHDPRLRARWIELSSWFKENCRDRKYDGLFVERYIEKIHGLPAEIVSSIKEHRWLATYVPKPEDGLGWRKAEYYILNQAAGNFGDAGINLLIMANTSIGTTPILLGLKDELPRVREELAPLAEDSARLGEIEGRIAGLIRAFEHPNPAWIKKEYEAVMKLVEERVRRTRVVKYLGANFLRAFYGAGLAGQRGDFGGFMTKLKAAGELFDRLMPDVAAALEELPRREECHKLFLRYLGHGGVSAFALTEPTAGSDSGGVKTTAKLKKAKLTPLADGRFLFHPDEGDVKKTRHLIDAARVVFTDQGVAYQTPDDQATQVQYDRYDYATDEGVRYYQYKGKTCEFHDIGQVRPSESGPVYEYYILTGAKMWITNGSIATQFCVYAQTAEGVTGFMVDRHAEGLKVGADEKKMGQRGSPTNEIAIDGVRVPREAVIGYEGHGQVNALETLNVGRCGLAVVSGALMHKMLEESRTLLASTAERDRILGEAAAILFGSESLAFYLIGLFDRPHESVRMESAIAKYACSEDIHEFISLVERAFGPESQTEKFLIEKARRDSRILTIYEGTNEVQRFLIVRDLIAQAAAWPELAAAPEDPRAETLAAWKNRLRAEVKDMAGLLGDTAWSDAMLQPALFPLAEMAAEILRLECIYYRMEWLDAKKGILSGSDPGYVPSLLEAGTRAAQRTELRLGGLHEKFMRLREQVRQNRYPAEVRAADAALDAFAETRAAGKSSAGMVRARVRILAIVRPVAELSPGPRISGGSINELVWRIDPNDLAGLLQALELKEPGDSRVSVDVLMPGGPEHEALLRNAAGVRADGLIRLGIDPASGPGAYAGVVQDLEVLRQYDLIVCGASCLNGDQGLGAYLAGNLGRLHYRRDGIEAKPDGTGLVHVALPAVISMTAKANEAGMNIEDAVGSALCRIRLIEQAEGPKEERRARFSLPKAAKAAAQMLTRPAQAAEYLRTIAASVSAGAAHAYAGEPLPGALPQERAVWAVLDPSEQKSNIAVVRAARHMAALTGRKAHALAAAPKEAWPLLLGLAQAQGCDQAFCIDTKSGRLSHEGKRELIQSVLKTSDAAIVFTGPEWVSACAFVAGESGRQKPELQLFSGVTNIEKPEGGTLSFFLPAYEGKLVLQRLVTDGPSLVCAASEADFPVPAAKGTFKATVLDFATDPDRIMPLRPEAAATLSQAEVIIDLGYGIRDQSGLALAQELAKKLATMGLAPMFGATRKVTQDLKLLPLEAQIGQTGVRVNPKLVIALGVSGAPQHIDYIGTRAEILCFNKDPEAPLMKLNQVRPAPRVHPVAGDLFATIRELIDKLG